MNTLEWFSHLENINGRQIVAKMFAMRNVSVKRVLIVQKNGVCVPSKVRRKSATRYIINRC